MHNARGALHAFFFGFGAVLDSPLTISITDVCPSFSDAQFRQNLNSVQFLNDGAWGVANKMAMIQGVVVVAQAPAPVAAVAYQPAPSFTPPPQQVMATPPPAVMSPPVMVPVAQSSVLISSSPAPVVSAGPPAGKLARVGGKSGGNGASTFLYMSSDKAKKRAAEVGAELSGRVGTNVTLEVDLNSILKDPNFTKESEADQKALLAGPIQASWSGALFAANNGTSTVEAAIRSGMPVTKVKWSYTNTMAPTSGWGFLEVVGSGSELHIKCPIACCDETYGASGGAAVAPQAAPVTVAAAPVVFKPVAAAVPVHQPAPVVHSPVVAPVVHIPIAAPSNPLAAAPAPAPAAPTGPIPGGRYTFVGGKAGGNGTTGFLYTPLEKFKKFVSDNVSKAFGGAISSTRVAVAIDGTFAKHPTFTQLSEVDQRGILAGPLAYNVPQLLYEAPNGDHMAALFRSEAYMGRCLKITKITITFVPDVASAEGFSGFEFIWSDNGTEIILRIDIKMLDYYFEASAWCVSKKAHEGIFGIEKRAAEAARLLEERRAMEALEIKAKANQADSDRKAAEEKAAAAKVAEQDRLRKELEASAEERVKTLEDAGVTPHMREHNERLNMALSRVGVSGEIKYVVDDLFIHDRKLRWRDCGTQKTTLKSISIEPWSLFTVLTDATIAIAQSGAVGQGKLMTAYNTYTLQFEVADAKQVHPRFLRDESGNLLILGTFSNLYDPRKWIDTYLEGQNPKNIWQGTTIVEVYKAMLADTAGFLEDMARDECTTLIDDQLSPYWKPHFEGRQVPIEVDWKSLDGFNLKAGLMARLKKHYQFPTCVLVEVFNSFKLANDVVMKVLRKNLKVIRVVASGSDGITLENKGEKMTIVYNWDKQSCPDKNWKTMIEDQVRAKCEGLTVKNVSAEIAMAEAAPGVLELNRTLVSKIGMISASGGFDVLVVDYPAFVDSLEFSKAHDAAKYRCIFTSNLGTLKALVRGFGEVAKTTLGGPLLKTVKRINVKLDLKSKDNSDDAPMVWDEASKTFTITHTFHSFEHPESYNYTPRIEYTMNILIESCRLETKQIVDKFYAQVRKDYQLNSLPVIIDESYQQTKEFTSIHPANMKAIIMRMFTTLPQSIFHGPMGLFHCAEFPKAREILHAKVKKIRLLPDGKMASNTHQTSLTDGELLVRVAFDCKDWNNPIGYHVTQLIGSRATMESEVIAEIDAGLVGVTDHLRKTSGNNKITVSFDWAELLKDSTFQASPLFVNDYIRYVAKKIKVAFDGTAAQEAIFDFGITPFLKNCELAPALAGVDKLVFHMSTKNNISTQGKHGLFTPYEYDVTQTGKDVHIRFNYRAYPVGVGSLLEFVLNPKRGEDREREHVIRISKRNYQEEMERRENEIQWTHNRNNSNQREYESDVNRYNRDMAHYARTGRFMPRMPAMPQTLPIPTFPHVTVADFADGLHRGELRMNHYNVGE